MESGTENINSWNRSCDCDRDRVDM